MKAPFLMTIALIIFASCSSKNELKSEKKTEEQVSEIVVKEPKSEQIPTTEKELNEFQTYIRTLDRIPLPLEHNPVGKLPELSKEYDKSAFSKFKHRWCSQPLGILYMNEESVTIIDCSVGDWGLVPFLMSYDLKGNRLDSAIFYKKSGMDMGYQAMEYLTFNEDRSIVVLDTVKRWDINEEEGDIVEGSMKLTSSRTEYNISSSGKVSEN